MVDSGAKFERVVLGSTQHSETFTILLHGMITQKLIPYTMQLKVCAANKNAFYSIFS